jgi:hypothetical protein
MAALEASRQSTCGREVALTVEQSPLVATRAEAAAEAEARGDGGKTEKIGYVFWGALALFVAIPELVAAGWHVPWPTISETVGHLEKHHHWVRVLVVAGLASLTTRVVFYPWPNKTPDPPARSVMRRKS